MDNKIIIWGRDGFNVLGLLRAFGKAELNVFFLIKRGAGYATKSRYCTKFHCVDGDEEGMNYLLEHFSNESAKPIIITPGDEIAVFINNNKEKLEKHFIIPGTTERGLQQKYTDKNNMCQLAKRIGILCPEFRYCQWDSNIEGVNYPCLIKPAHEKAGHYNEFKYKICKDRASLERTLKMVRKGSEFVIQDYIQKEKDVLVFGARLYDGNTVFAGAVTCTRYSDSGMNSYGEVIRDVPQCIDTEKIRSFLSKIDYRGFFSFEYGLIDDKAYFFEVNLRNDGTIPFINQAGSQIALAYVYSCAGIDYSGLQISITKDKWYIDELFDFENVLTGKVNYHQWKRDKKLANAFLYYDKEDEEPWRHLKKRRWVIMAKEIFVKRFRPYIVFVLDKLGIKK